MNHAQDRTEPTLHHPPSGCPVCGHGLALTRLGCTECGTEIAGMFTSCAFCALDADELATLGVFLTSRGNMREVERHLGVSYPTARLRFTQLLGKLGLAGEAEVAEPEPDQAGAEAGDNRPSREQILTEVASGALSPEQAQALLTRGLLGEG